MRTCACMLTLLLMVDGAYAEPINISLTYDSVMDMVRPMQYPGISVHHNMQITMNGSNLSENRDRSTGKYFDKAASVMEHGSEGAGNVTWHVIDANHLVRMQTFTQSSRKMIVSVNPQEKTCSLSVSDTLKPGFNEYAFLRVQKQEIAYFSSYHVVSTSCTIQ
jgi:hypothetical protein